MFLRFYFDKRTGECIHSILTIRNELGISLLHSPIKKITEATFDHIVQFKTVIYDKNKYTIESIVGKDHLWLTWAADSLDPNGKQWSVAFVILRVVSGSNGQIELDVEPEFVKKYVEAITRKPEHKPALAALLCGASIRQLLFTRESAKSNLDKSLDLLHLPVISNAAFNIPHK